jgi:Protein of unknown function (DUF2283)
MMQTHLQVTYVHGRFFAAYLYLPRRQGDRSSRTEKTRNGLILDFAPDGRAIGVEILAPKEFDLAELNAVLKQNGQAPLRKKDVAPIHAA